MGKHTLKIEYDYDFVLIGISSHEKDYRLCWALNNVLELELTKTESLEIKSKKEDTPSFFSLFKYENEAEFKEYFVLSNLSENKHSVLKEDTLFNKRSKESSSAEKGILIPEHRQMNYFFIIRGEITDREAEKFIKRINSIDMILTAVQIEPNELKSKANLIF